MQFPSYLKQETWAHHIFKKTNVCTELMRVLLGTYRLQTIITLQLRVNLRHHRLIIHNCLVGSFVGINPLSIQLTDLDIITLSNRTNAFESTDERLEIDSIESKLFGTPGYDTWLSVRDRMKSSFKVTERTLWSDIDIVLFFIFAKIYGGSIDNRRLSNLNKDKLLLILYHCRKTENSKMSTTAYSSIREKFLRHEVNATLLKLWDLAQNMVKDLGLNKKTMLDIDISAKIQEHFARKQPLLQQESPTISQTGQAMDPKDQPENLTVNQATSMILPTKQQDSVPNTAGINLSPN